MGLKEQLCGKICKKCARMCQAYLNHIGDCSCGTEHICLEVCNSSSECVDNIFKCVSIYGHEDEGDYSCSGICKVENCSFPCDLEKTHSF